MSDTPGWQDTDLSGVLIRRLQPHADDRGSLTELWRGTWTAGLLEPGVVQANLSRSRAGVLRGMHLHLRQTDVWVMMEGSATVALADLRSRSDTPTRRPPVLVVEVGPATALLIPPRVAHGLYAHQDVALLYLVSAEYDGADELGFRWDDQDADIRWPDADPIISERDRTAPSLTDLLDRLALHG